MHTRSLLWREHCIGYLDYSFMFTSAFMQRMTTTDVLVLMLLFGTWSK